MAHYLRTPEPSYQSEVWLIDERVAQKAGIGSGPSLWHYDAFDGELIWDAIDRYTSWPRESFIPLVLEPGLYHPRVARPLLLASEPTLWCESGNLESAHVASCRSQLVALVRQLQDICRTVEPEDRTLDVHGHNIRNLLILAATEVEMHWRGVLRQNGKPSGRFTTNDYVVLADVLRLREYSVAFRDFPALPPLSPFTAWGMSGAPSKELPWFEAYHAVKHDREGQFEQATLRSALTAVAANAIMLVAQFGQARSFSSELSTFFHFAEVPTWPEGDGYVGSFDGDGWVAINHPAVK
jgi:hypothetical protein